ncbi:MAG: aminotransferase class V-fold PLP-dependent enzyme [Chromatiales bacterium]|nr:aminotransferase class V-fold PLP-dependent enzyme [Chromatiales bacterium]
MDDVPHMTPGEFRRCGHAVVERIARYMEEIERYPVLSRAEPGSIRERLPHAAPEHGEPFSDVLRDVDEIVMPGITHWQSPNFFAYFPANASGPSILGDLLSSGLGVQGMLWATSPACTELETHVLDWLVELLGLPDRFRSATAGGGVIQDTASSSTLTALLAARERASAGSVNEHGVGFGPDRGSPQRLTVYTSRHAHSSIEKAVKIAGLGRTNLRLVDADARHAMRPDALEAAVAADRAAGATPAMVSATVGTTSSGAVDPVRAIGEVCRREGVWLHVDAAHAGSATICPEHRGLVDGVELADSYTFNPHKWLLTNFDCNCFWVADRAALIGALSILPEYLRNRATTSGDVIDYRDWHVPLGRRFRALKLWFVIRHYGAEGLRAHVRRSVALADWFAAQMEASDGFELAAPVSVGLVCFRHRAGDAFNQTLMDRLNRSGALYLTHTRLDDRLVLRLAVGGPATRREHVEAAWTRIVETAGRISVEMHVR